jgi:hypothetical protein
MRAFFLFLLVFPLFLRAQDSVPPREAFVPAITIKSNVLPFISPIKAAANISTDIRLARRFTVDLGAGWFIPNIYGSKFKGETFEGLRLRTGAKYIFTNFKDGSASLGLLGKYNDIRDTEYRNVVRQGGQYVEQLLVTRNLKTKGIGIHIGLQFYSGKRNRLVIESFGGFGMLHTQITDNMPADAERTFSEWTFNLDRDPGTYRSLDIFCGMHIGIALW